MKIATCKTCDGRVVWVNTITGARMPVDAEPSAIGNIILEERAGQPPLARVRPPAELAAAPVRYVSHFATCRDAAAHRRPR